MCENSNVPFTIIKEKNGDAAENQYEWKKTLVATRTWDYVIKNITLVQEPTERLDLNVTLRQANTDSITYDLKIDFHNYSHEFSNNYSYEVMCRVPRVDIPDAYLFLCVEPRLEKTITFKKSYASAVCGNSQFMISSSEKNLYFGIRRIDHRNRNINTSVSLCGMSTFLKRYDSKVILQMEDGQVTAHKSVLSFYSDVFKAMFVHEMKEKQEGVLKISDFDSKVVRKMVEYLYTGKLGNITDMVQDLFKLAHRYQLHELCRHCEEYYVFNFNLNNDHIIEILELVDLYELKELEISAGKFVQRYEQNMCQSSRYQEYMCQSMRIDKAVNYLILADKYEIKDVKTQALDFLKMNHYKMAKNEDFLKLFEKNPRLMKEIFLHSAK